MNIQDLIEHHRLIASLPVDHAGGRAEQERCTRIADALELALTVPRLVETLWWARDLLTHAPDTTLVDKLVADINNALAIVADHERILGGE